MTFCRSRLILSMIAFGVPLGAKKPYQLDSSFMLMPSSIMVGSSGRSFERVGPLTASARTLPELMCGSEPPAVVNQISVRPEKMSE